MAAGGLTFNQFQVELKKRNIDGPIAIVLTMMYEQIRSEAEQLDEIAKIILGLAQTIENFVQLHEATQGQVDRVRQMVDGKVAGVEFNSVSLRDDDE